MLISRKPFTDWEFKINLLLDGDEPDPSTTEQQVKDAHLDIFYRTTWDGKDIEQFSMTAEGCDDLFLQVRIYSMNDIRIFSWLPHLIERKKKVFHITPLYKLTPLPAGSEHPYKLSFLAGYMPRIPMVIP